MFYFSCFPHVVCQTNLVLFTSFIRDPLSNPNALIIFPSVVEPYWFSRNICENLIFIQKNGAAAAALATGYGTAPLFFEIPLSLSLSVNPVIPHFIHLQSAQVERITSSKNVIAATHRPCQFLCFNTLSTLRRASSCRKR